MAIRIEEHSAGIRVISDAWEIEHLKEAGGAWSSIVFRNGSRKNLLRNPVSSAIRFVRANPYSESGVFTAFAESHEHHPRLRHDVTPAGNPIVIAEGTFSDEHGKTIPVGYRRSTEYQPHGLIWTTLEIMSDCGCGDAVELRAFGLALRPGMSGCSVRFHPSQAGGTSLLGARASYDLSRADATPFLSRFTPLQMLCRDKNGEGIELFPGSELSQWDCGVRPDAGLGLYSVRHGESGTSLELNPYCMALHRMGATLQGHLVFKLGIALPSGKAPASASNAQVVLNSKWASDAEIDALANRGVKVIRFQNAYREDGPFWPAGAWTPYDDTNASELRRVIERVHGCGMKIVPYLSLKEFHPQSRGFAEHAHEWMHKAAPSMALIHNYAGSGEYGALMCLKSGWLPHLKQSVDRILSSFQWDGLCLDWSESHPCCHSHHARGPFHTDVEGVADILAHCRKQVGAGILMVVKPETPSWVCENLADMYA